jgi:hypothetical protein
MTRRTFPLFASVTGMILSADAAAQKSPTPAATESGLTAYVQFGGTANADGAVYAVNPSIGYDFNLHFGLAVGAPIYFIRPSASTGGSVPAGWATRILLFTCDTQTKR